MIVCQLDLQLPVQSVPINIKGVSSNSVHGEMYSIQHYLIKFDSDLWQIGGFPRLLRFVSYSNKTDNHDTTEILLKVALNTIARNNWMPALGICQVLIYSDSVGLLFIGRLKIWTECSYIFQSIAERKTLDKINKHLILFRLYFWHTWQPKIYYNLIYYIVFDD